MEIVRYVIVCDTGRTINPMLAEGQLHGGAAQGLGQAVLEQVVYDPETGQPLTGSLMDYAIPRADDLPALEVVMTEMAETDNPLGVKGIGEGPTTGAPSGPDGRRARCAVDGGDHRHRHARGSGERVAGDPCRAVRPGHGASGVKLKSGRDRMASTPPRRSIRAC